MVGTLEKKLDAGWPESEEEQVGNVKLEEEVRRRSKEDNQVKQLRRQDRQTDILRLRHREILKCSLRLIDKKTYVDIQTQLKRVSGQTLLHTYPLHTDAFYSH